MTDKTDAGEEKRFGALDVVALAQESYLFARASDGSLVAYPKDPRVARLATEIRALRPILTRDLANRERVVGRDTMSAALDVLQAFAADSMEERVYLRAAQAGCALHLDLAERSENASFVEISSHGWEVRRLDAEEEGAARPIFRRSSATKALPLPRPGGSRDLLREVLGFSEGDPRWTLVWGWLVASLFESVPRPILWVLGPQGSGKSTRARMILSVVEPCDAMGRPPGENSRDDDTSARGRYLPSWDNVGTIGAKTSDWLCRLVTGVEVDRRALYTDDDVRTTVLRRSGVATSIVLPYGLGADALERLVLLDLERVPDADRKPEDGLWSLFRERHPLILAALLDDVSGALRLLSQVRDDPPDRLPRMADYALILAALDEHVGNDPDEGYLSTYTSAVSGVLANRAHEDPLAAALLRVAATGGGSWEGTPTVLFERLKMLRPDERDVPWPHSPRSLGGAIRRASETLRAAGLDVSDRKVNGVRRVRLALLPAEDDAADEAA